MTMNNKTRVKRLEDKAKPANKYIVIWEDMNDPGAFYTTCRPEDGKRLTEAEIEALGSDPGAVILEVRYIRTAPKN